MSTVKWLESKIISETQRAKYAEGRVHALLLELDKKDAALRRAKAEGWPKVNAPAMYDDPDPGWVDTAVPDLARIWELSREVGYAIGLHGSLKRDMDLIAAPWTDEAIGNAGLIDHLCAGLPAVRIGGPERKSHGRIAVTLQMDGYFKPIDLSIMPRLDARAAQIDDGEST